MEILNVSEQQEPVSGESGSVEPAVHSPDLSSERGAEPAPSSEVTASLEPSIRTEAPDLVPDQDVNEAPEVHAPQTKAAGVTAPDVHVAKANSSRPAGRLMIMSPGDRTWSNESEAPDAKAEAAENPDLFGKRRFGAMAAVIALATVAGALGGALATASFGHVTVADTSTPSKSTPSKSTASNQALEATVARIDADVMALKAGVEHTSRMEISQFNKTSDRLDKLEKAQAEPAAKLAKLSEAVEKLHAMPPAAAPAPQAASREVTGSVTPQAAAAAPVNPASPKIEVARLPTVEDWALRDIARGGALIEGRQGIYEVYAGDQVPGLGRVDAIRRQDGRWVVVTSRGLIVAR
jgi:hypothetical protein